jgi:hypothetical protein
MKKKMKRREERRKEKRETVVKRKDFISIHLDIYISLPG